MKSSQQIIRWLGRIEQMAGDLYSGGAMLFRADRQFSEFLEHLAEDEAWHFQLMSSAADSLRNGEDEFHEINVDSQTRERIEDPFTENYRMLIAGTLTKESLIDCIITTEYSEWNPVFLYAVNMLKERKHEFGHVASGMRRHISEIERFLKQQPRGDYYIDRIRGVSGMMGKKILVVEDHQPIAELMTAILENEGTVTMARNGQEGYELVLREYYDAIITDIEMPVMDGIEFYKLAVQFDRNFKERFLFYSSTYDDRHLQFIKKHHLRFVRKPGDINDIRESVRAIISEAAVKG
jgi:CheY-like chemotaxis protein/rubrerythrin